MPRKPKNEVPRKLAPGPYEHRGLKTSTRLARSEFLAAIKRLAPAVLQDLAQCPYDLYREAQRYAFPDSDRAGSRERALQRTYPGTGIFAPDEETYLEFWDWRYLLCSLS